jgi:hypothetical protein
VVRYVIPISIGTKSFCSWQARRHFRATRDNFSFNEFEKMWDEGKIENKHSHEIESDFMDWEMKVENYLVF